jgi:hypothetical protein
MLLSKAIQQYKSAVTRKINLLGDGFSFQWQKSFYDHVIRNDRSLANLRQYVQNNPLKWELDVENKGAGGDTSSPINCEDYYRKIIAGINSPLQ